jgi:hypothetical protein
MTDDEGTLRGLILGTVLALLMILGLNALGRWDQAHKAATPVDSVLRIPG